MLGQGEGGVLWTVGCFKQCSPSSIFQSSSTSSTVVTFSVASYLWHRDRKHSDRAHGALGNLHCRLKLPRRRTWPFWVTYGAPSGCHACTDGASCHLRCTLTLPCRHTWGTYDKGQGFTHTSVILDYSLLIQSYIYNPQQAWHASSAKELLRAMLVDVGECCACSAHAVRSFGCRQILGPYFWPLFTSFWFHTGFFF